MKNSKRSFTLIEVMITLSILAVLSGITLFVTNPTIITDNVQDNRRVSDLNNIEKAINYLDTVSMNMLSLGDTNTVYLSLPDNTSASCASYVLPSLPSGYSYSCKNETNYTKNDGNG